MIPETRRAAAAFTLLDNEGRVIESGEGQAVIGDDAVSVGPVTISFLDADALAAADYRIEIEVWPTGRIVLSQIGRRYDTFLHELKRARNQARVAGLLAHGITMPTVFACSVRVGTAQGPAEVQVYDTHLTVIPPDADPWQIGFGETSALRNQTDPPGVIAERRDGSTVLFGHLARDREAFLSEVNRRRDAQLQCLSKLTGRSGFSDGMGLPLRSVHSGESLLERFTATNRTSNLRDLLALGDEGARVGFVQLLDPDGERLTCPGQLPENWAVFLLVPIGDLTVLEILAGPAAATYVFNSDISSVNRDLQLLHFRRAPLALAAGEADPTPDNPFRLALRRLEPLQRLRASTKARVLHTESWADSLRAALA